MIDKILKDREHTHGSYQDSSTVAIELKRVIWYHVIEQKDFLPDDMQQSLDMICSKIARIICGDHNEIDHWNDIAGYSQLVINRLNIPQTPKKSSS
jgi:hypothetical protein